MASLSIAEALSAAGDDPRLREGVLTKFLAEAVDQMSILQTELNRTKEELQKAQDTAAGKPGGETKRLPLSKQRGLERVPEFAGVYAEYHNFRKKALTFFADCPGLRDLLRDLEKSSKTFDANGYYYTELQAEYTGLNVKEISGEVHTVLVLVTSGTASSMVDATDGNGLQAWRRLYTEYNDLNPTGKRQLLDSIMHPRRAKAVDDIPAA